MEIGLLQGASDCHSHILYGVDDGIGTLEESMDAIRQEESVGITDLWCTPHVMEDMPNTTDGLKRRFDELKSAYSGKIKLHLAAEYMLDTLFEERLRENDLLLMKEDQLLVETSVWTPPMNMQDKLARILRRGYNLILAHPERYRYLNEAGYRELFNMGIRFQLNLPSVVGYYGESVRQKAFWLLEHGMYGAMGTDCHRAKALGQMFSERKLSRNEVNKLKILSDVGF